MPGTEELLRQHTQLTRRYFVGLGAAAIAGVNLVRADAETPPELGPALARLEYLTHSTKFTNFGRGTPPPDTLSPEARRAAGLDRETWRLEVMADPDTDAEVAHPLTKDLGTALTWDDLLGLAAQRATCYLHVLTCLNAADPCGMGLWEGVPLRDVVWLAKPVRNIRRVFYSGFHNDDPAQIFRSSLPIGRVLEDPPGEPPVMLCYRLNGEYLSPQRGGPVRMFVPDAYGFKSVKWLQKVVLSNTYQANDTYAEWNNDIDTSLKTFARFLSYPAATGPDQSIPVTGLAQVGVSGLSAVQVQIVPAGQASDGDWREAIILGPPERWGGDVGDGPLPGQPMAFDALSGKPETWPQRFTIAHWAALLPKMPAGRYHLRCRTIDAAGHSQPMPRPFPKSGRNAIHQVDLTVEG